MFYAMNRFQVALDRAAEFEEAWRSRESTARRECVGVEPTRDRDAAPQRF